MSRIRDITVVPVAHVTDPSRAYGTSRGLTHAHGAVLVLLATEDGVQGLGEAGGRPASSAPVSIS